jgi:pantothenate kinase
LLEADRATLIALLKAYDAGALAADTTNNKFGYGGGAESSKAPAGYWYDGPSSFEVAADWYRSDLEVVAQILDAPGYKGCDIGGTLWKLVLALPENVEADHRYPDEFGTTGRTRPDLDFVCEWGGRHHLLRFVSGATSQIEASIRHFGTELDEEKPSSQDGESDESSTRVGSHESSDASGKDMPSSGSSNPPSPRRSLAERRCQLGSTNSLASMGRCSSYNSLLSMAPQKVFAAGGGAHKFAQQFQDILQMEMVAVKELTAVVDGLIFLMLHGPRSGSLFTASGADSVPLPWPEPLFPFIVVNMGSGVSILRVDSARENDYVRVGGTACGGGTFLGLARALTSAETFEEALQLAEGGDASRCDLLVRDIYGNDGSVSLGLPGGLTAANFGKLCDSPDEDDSSGLCSEQDLARSLLQMVVQQSVLLSSAFARHAGCIDRVFFVGGFVEKENHLARKTIADNFKSLGGCAYFLRHSDFLGALGSLWVGLRDADPDAGSKDRGRQRSGIL